MLRASALALTLFLVLGLAAPAAGQGKGNTKPKGKLEVSLLNPTVGFPAPAVADFDAGWLDHPGIVVSIQSRPPAEPWELRLRADGPEMGGYGKPVGDLYWRTDGRPSWTPVSGTDQLIAQGQGDSELTVYFRIALDWGRDVPGSYLAGLTFSLLRP